MATVSHLKRKPKAVENTMTPPMATRSRSSSVSSFDDEAYFSKTYVPLSSLPTPPLSNCSRQQSPEALFSENAAVLDPELLGPAIHLTNLIPSSTSLTTPSVPLVHAILTRADLPLEMIALAVCILDSLNSRFALQWRTGCPLVKNMFSSTWTDTETTSEQHIDSIHPELIILSALVLAVKFLDDAEQHTKEYAEDWGKRLWTCDQVNYTQRCLLENLGYRLLPLWDHGIILEALEDMERAGRQFQKLEMHSGNEDRDMNSTCFNTFRSSNLVEQTMSAGQAVKGFGQQITPAETPTVKNVKGAKDVSHETKSAFQAGNGDVFQLPDRSKVQKEPFPDYDDPVLRGFGMGIGWGV